MLLSKLIHIDLMYRTREGKERIPKIAEAFSDGRALNVGSGQTDYGEHFVNVEITPFENVDVVTTGDRLPFPDEYFDLVVSQAVLEHVEHPGKVVREMLRVLKRGGEIYAEVPFIQGFHPTPGDYQRYTITGIENLFRGTQKIEKGIVNGPASAMCWIARDFLAVLFSFNSQTLYKVGLVLFGWLLFPLKFLDAFMEKSSMAPGIASGFFYHGRKI